MLPVNALSAEDNSANVINTDPMSGHYLFQLIIGLIIVLLCIVALAWFAKRVNHLQSSGDGVLKIMGGLSMGARERVVLLQVGSDQVLIGVSPGRINTLHVLDAPIENDGLTTPSVAGKSFADKFKDVLSASNAGSANNISVNKSSDNKNNT